MSRTNDTRLTSFAERLDRLEDEKQGIASDIKDVYAEVKSAGYNPKALRRVLADRRRKPDAEFEADLDLYRAALGVPGATYRSVAGELGVSKSKLQRLVPRKENGTSGVVAESSGQPDASQVEAAVFRGVDASRPLDTQPEDALEIPAHLRRARA